MKYPYFAAMALIFGAGLLSQLFGLLLAAREVNWWGKSVIPFAGALFLSLLFDFLLVRKWVKTWDLVSRPDD